VDRAGVIEALPVESFDPGQRLLVAAGGVLSQMMDDLAGAPLAVLLADRDGLVVDARTPTMRGQMADLTVSRVGRRCLEEFAGTNSIGTALELSRPVRIRGAEHYLESLQAFDCLGVPVIHPTTARSEGVLSLCGAHGALSPALAPFLTYAARDIQKQLHASTPRGQLELLAAFHHACRSPGAVVVLGPDMVLATPDAAAMLDAVDHQMLRDRGGSLQTGAVARLDADLSSGRRVRLALERCGSDRSRGVLARISTETCDARPRVPRGANARGPAGDTISQALDAARSTGAPVLITGEAGTGRSRAVRTLAADAPVHVVDCTATAEPVAAFAAALSAARGGADVIALDGIESVSAAAARDLLGLVISADVRVVMTAPPLDELSGAHAALIACCRNHVHIPPLRARASELPALLETVTSALALQLGVPPVRWSAEALAVLLAHSWPGNLHEFRVVVEQVLRSGTAPVVSVDALPSSVRESSRRRLSPLQRSEREVITATLQACNGNKVHAAGELGISRSTLYKRMRELGICAD
jgi:transcriptional regulator of acetoin/glycerol metabolism